MFRGSAFPCKKREGGKTAGPSRMWLPATGRPRERGGDVLPPSRCSVLEPVRPAPGYQVKTYCDDGYSETPWARVLCGANQLGLFVLMMRVTRRFRPLRRRAVSTRAATRGRGDTPRRGLRPRWRVCSSGTCGVRVVATRLLLPGCRVHYGSRVPQVQQRRRVVEGRARCVRLSGTPLLRA